MRVTTPFDPIEVGEVDNFAFDFYRRCGHGLDRVDDLDLYAGALPDGH